MRRPGVGIARKRARNGRDVAQVGGLDGGRRDAAAVHQESMQLRQVEIGNGRKVVIESVLGAAATLIARRTGSGS